MIVSMYTHREMVTYMFTRDWNLELICSKAKFYNVSNIIYTYKIIHLIELSFFAHANNSDFPNF